MQSRVQWLASKREGVLPSAADWYACKEQRFRFARRWPLPAGVVEVRSSGARTVSGSVVYQVLPEEGQYGGVELLMKGDSVEPMFIQAYPGKSLRQFGRARCKKGEVARISHEMVVGLYR